jgi:hypothetical protein
MIDGVLYVTTPYTSIAALDAELGKEIWRFDTEAYKLGQIQSGSGWKHRGAAFWRDGDVLRIFMNSRSRLFMLDARTGKPVPSFGTNGYVQLTDGPNVAESEADRRHDEAVGGHDLACVIGQKRAPGLGRWTPMPSHVLGHGRLTHRDPHLQELAVNPRGTPQRIRGGHVANQRAHVRWQRWAPGAVSAFPGPKEAKPAAMPRDDGLRFDDVNRRAPAAPGV